LYTVSKGCRVTGAPDLVDLLFLGDQPLANSLKDAVTDPEPKVPLTLCYSPRSSLVQLKETVRKELLFSNYVWVSGTAATTRAYADTFSRRLATFAGLKPGDLVVEIGSNDGTFLKPFLAAGFSNLLGVDPAANIASMANRDGVRTLNRFWGIDVARQIAAEHGTAKAIFARNVIAHVSELQDVMEGISVLLADDGVGAVEFHYAGDILDGLQYDSIYHEHLCYFSVRSFEALLSRHKLDATHVDFSPISGGAVVLYFAKRANGASPELDRLRRSEEEKGVHTLDRWKAFAEDCRRHREKTLSILSDFQGKSVVGFGASARSSTYINYCGLDARHLKAVIDNSPLKRGKFTPGSSLAIVPFDQGMAMKPDLLFVFAWNFRDEVIASCRKAGYTGRFLTAFPNDLAVI